MLTTVDIDAYIQDPTLIAKTWQSNDPTLSEDPSGELTVVEARIQVVSSILASLFNQSHQLKGRINDLHCPLIRILPPEIIAEIFRCCLPDFLPFCMDEFTDLKKYAVPLILGGVCGAWRRIAWSTPSLWSTVTLRVTNPNSVPSQVVLLDEWLTRSGQLPLNIRLCSTEDVSWGGTTPEGFMVALNKHSDRWKLLDIRFPSLCYKFFPVEEEGKSFPMLSSVLLKPPGGQGDRIHRVNLPNTPQLHHVNLSCLYLRSLNFQWDALRSLELDSFYNDECVEMLRQTTNLVKFTIRKLLGGDDRHEMPENPVLVPSLEEMIIHNDKDTDITQLVSNIATPKLTTLCYTGEGNTRCPRQELISFIRRSECQLKTLRLADCTLSEVGLEQLLRVMPTLTTLSLSFPFHASAPQPITDSLIRLCDPVFANALKQECLLPELRTFNYVGPPSFSYPAIAKMLQTRTFTIQTQQNLVDTLLEQVESARKAQEEAEAIRAAEAERLAAEAAMLEAQTMEESALFGIDVSVFEEVEVLNPSDQSSGGDSGDLDLLNIDASLFNDDIHLEGLVTSLDELASQEIPDYIQSTTDDATTSNGVLADDQPVETEESTLAPTEPEESDEGTDSTTFDTIINDPAAQPLPPSEDEGEADDDNDNDDNTLSPGDDTTQAQSNPDATAPIQPTTIVNITTHTETDNDQTIDPPIQTPDAAQTQPGSDDNNATQDESDLSPGPATDLSQTPPPTFPNPPPPILTILTSLTELEGNTTPVPPRPKLAPVSVLSETTLTLKCQYVPPPDPFFPALLQSTEEETGIVLFKVTTTMVMSEEEA
ncbi:hypothetical protein BJ165DRAFT_1449362 [Panaeolus papilionaceus]|nr:hypothetical protein BJ165DRAFT_1449362 [Panaeolus papilionaceus]